MNFDLFVVNTIEVEDDNKVIDDFINPDTSDTINEIGVNNTNYSSQKGLIFFFHINSILI